MAAPATQDKTAQAAVRAAAEAKRQAQQQLAETIKNARRAYSAAVADAKVTRDGAIAAAYAAFAQAAGTGTD